MFRLPYFNQILRNKNFFSSNNSFHRIPIRKQPKIVQYYPMRKNLTSNETYYWCTCGLSINQPFCDGTHKGSIFRPVKFTVPKDGKYSLCACKYNKPESGEKCDWSCAKNFIKRRIFMQTLHKDIPIPKEGDKDPRENLKRFLHVRDTEH